MKTSRYVLLAAFLVALFLTSGGLLPAEAREVVVRRGESLSLIAGRELGSMDRWTELARLNGITDPRRLREGQVLRLPGGEDLAPVVVPAAGAEAVPSVPHVAGRPSLRRLAGAVRVRPPGASGWLDLHGAVEAVTGIHVMTANTGRSDLQVEDLNAEIGPFSILQLAGTDDGVKILFIIGQLTVRGGLDCAVEAEGTRIVSSGGDFRASLDEAGTLKVMSLSGRVELHPRGGTAMPLAPGYQATMRRGAAPELREVVSPVKLVAPEDGKATTEPNILFQWNPVAGARGYQFTLTPSSPTLPRLVEEVQENRILVNAVPEGTFTWSVVPLGLADAVAARPSRLVVDRSAPPLRLDPPRAEGNEWVISGRTAPNAAVVAGAERLTAGPDGSFEVRHAAVPGLLVLGVEARTRAGGTPTRAAVAMAGRPEGRDVPAMVEVPAGRVTFNEEPAAPVLSLAEGMTTLAWSWDVEREKVAGGAVKLFIDLTAPEITNVRSTPERVFGGEPLTIAVKARDRGVGLAEASTAVMHVVGPGQFSADVRATELNGEGEYVFRVETPRNLGNGYLRVTRLELSDKDGNAIVLSSEGMATEMVDPRSRFQKLLSGVLIFGLGVLVGAL